jgi:hypothetical protein
MDLQVRTRKRLWLNSEDYRGIYLQKPSNTSVDLNQYIQTPGLNTDLRNTKEE